MTDEIVSQAMKQAAHETPVLFYSPGIDPFLENLTKGAAFCFEKESPDIPKLFDPLNHKIKKSSYNDFKFDQYKSNKWLL